MYLSFKEVDVGKGIPKDYGIRNVNIRIGKEDKAL